MSRLNELLNRTDVNDDNKSFVKDIILDILYCGHMGAEQPIGREALRRAVIEEWQARYFPAELALDDRTLRNILEELRTTDVRGSRICAAPGAQHGGYFIAKRRRDLLANMRGDRNRALTIWNRMRAQRRLSIAAFADPSDDFNGLLQPMLFEVENA